MTIRFQTQPATRLNALGVLDSDAPDTIIISDYYEPVFILCVPEDGDSIRVEGYSGGSAGSWQDLGLVATQQVLTLYTGAYEAECQQLRFTRIGTGVRSSYRVTTS